MVTLRSTRYPGLLITDLGVRFSGGVLETDDPRVIRRARKLGRLGVTVEDDTGAGAEEVPAPVSTTEADAPTTEAPRGNASRAAWAAHAESLGISVPEDATRNEIRDLVAKQG